MDEPMKFRAERNAFVDAVVWAGRTVPVRPSEPALAGLRLVVTVDPAPTLTISSFDRDVSGQVEIPVEAEVPGEALVNGRLLADIAKMLPTKPVEVETVVSRVTVRSGRSYFELPSLPVDGYPVIPKIATTDGHLAGSAFAAAVGRVAVASRKEDTLPILTGIRVEVDGDLLTMVATDRYRLAVKTLPWEAVQPGFTAEALVSSRILLETAKSLAAAEQVGLAFGVPGGGDGLFGVEGASRRTTTRLLSGEFPKYKSLLPTTTPITARVETLPLIEAVRRVSLVSESSAVKLQFGESEVQLRAGSGSDSTGEDAIECTMKGGPVGSIAFNADFLVDGLNQIGQSVTNFAITSPEKPVVMTGAATYDSEVADDYLYLLMPIRQIS